MRVIKRMAIKMMIIILMMEMRKRVKMINSLIYGMKQQLKFSRLTAVMPLEKSTLNVLLNPM